MRLPDQAKGCDDCRTMHFHATGARSEVARARQRLRKHGLGDLAPRYLAETKAAVEKARDTDQRYLAHHAEAHPIPPGQVTLARTDNDRAPSHQKPALPPAADLAARLRAGETLEAVAAEYERGVATVAKRISMAGFNSRTGETRDHASRLASDGLPKLGLPYDARPWIDDALCAQTDPEAFFPEKGGATREAKKVCAVCPVRLPCLEDALSRDERFGVLGGLSERERRALKKAAS